MTPRATSKRHVAQLAKILDVDVAGLTTLLATSANPSRVAYRVERVIGCLDTKFDLHICACQTASEDAEGFWQRASDTANVLEAAKHGNARGAIKLCETEFGRKLTVAERRRCEAHYRSALLAHYELSATLECPTCRSKAYQLRECPACHRRMCTECSVQLPSVTHSRRLPALCKDCAEAVPADWTDGG